MSRLHLIVHLDLICFVDEAERHGRELARRQRRDWLLAVAAVPLEVVCGWRRYGGWRRCRPVRRVDASGAEHKATIALATMGIPRDGITGGEPNVQRPMRGATVLDRADDEVLAACLNTVVLRRDVYLAHGGECVVGGGGLRGGGSATPSLHTHPIRTAIHSQRTM